MLFYLNKRTRGAGGRRVWDLGLNRAPLSGRAISVGLQCVRPALSRLALLARLWTSNERNPMQPVRPTLSGLALPSRPNGTERRSPINMTDSRPGGGQQGKVRYARSAQRPRPATR